MKGLLHSKKFKSNLRKWLCMYVGVMMLLTTVITYSKYISSMLVEDNSEPNKFELNITPVACPVIEVDTPPVCNSSIPDSMSTSTCRPTSIIASCFTVDTAGIGVDSDLWLTFDPATYPNTVEPMFNIIGIDVLNENQSLEVYPSINQNWKYSMENDRLKLQKEVRAPSNNSWTIRVRSKRIISSVQDYATRYDGDLVKVGYVMEQKTTEGGN